jgi:hypothetical protein
MNSLITCCLSTQNFLLRIESGDYVHILCDETDIATKQQSLLTRRYILATGQIVEKFLEMHTGCTITLEKLSLILIMYGKYDSVSLMKHLAY